MKKRILSFVFVVILAVSLLPSYAAGASEWIVLAEGFTDCKNKGYSTHSYENYYTNSYWGAIAGHNCTNYVGYMLTQKGLSGVVKGNACDWDDYAHNKGYTVNQTASVGSVASWEAYNGGSGSAGHVAYVEKVTSTYILVSEDNYGGSFRWRQINKGSSYWPDNFLHFSDAPLSVSLSFSNVKTTDVTNTSARFQCTVKNPNGAAVSKVGIYIWDETGALIKDYTETVTTSAQTYSEISTWFDAGNELNMKLIPGTSYTYQMRAYTGSTWFLSSKTTVKTTGSKPSTSTGITMSNVQVTDLKDRTASMIGTVNNPNNKEIAQIGVQIWDLSGKLLKDYTKNVSSSFYTNTTIEIKFQTLEDLGFGLTPDTKYTFALRAYSGSTWYVSGTYSFTTAGDRVTISDAEVSEVTSNSARFYCTVHNPDKSMIVNKTIYIWDEDNQLVKSFSDGNPSSGTVIPISFHTDILKLALDPATIYTYQITVNSFISSEKDPDRYILSTYSSGKHIFKTADITSDSGDAPGNKPDDGPGDNPGGSNEQGPSFRDVPKSAWYYESVMYVYGNSIFSGTSANTFSPSTTMTRAMMVQVLYNIENTSMTAAGRFADVPSNAWYADAVNWAAENNVVSGVGNDCFAPGREVTRQEMAVILDNYCRYKGITLPTLREYDVFNDQIQVSSWATNAVENMYRATVLNGKGNGTFSPKGNATRAEVATLLMNFMEAA